MRAAWSLFALALVACTEKPATNERAAPKASASASASAPAPSASTSAAPSAVGSADAAPPVVIHGACTIKVTKTTVPVKNLDTTLAKLEPELRAVYDRALAKNPSIAGTAQFGAIIDVDGSFQSVVARGPEMPNKFVEDLTGVLRRAELEPADLKSRAVEIRGTIVCAPLK